MKFYKDSTTGLFMVGHLIFSPGQIYMRVNDDNEITFYYPNGEVINNAFEVLFSEFTDENDDAYTTIGDFLTVAASLIAGSPNDIISAIQSSGGSQFKSFSVEITRPANTTVYSPGDVVADVSAAFVRFANVAKSTGAVLRLSGVGFKPKILAWPELVSICTCTKKPRHLLLTMPLLLFPMQMRQNVSAHFLF